MITKHTYPKYAEMSFAQKHHTLVLQQCSIIHQASGT